jgi:glucose-6-phosphate 1-dehydrogenase
LGGAGERLHYFATPPTLFQPIAERVGAMSMAPRSAAAVDTRLGHELTFPWPIDADLRRLLDANSVLRLELTGS